MLKTLIGVTLLAAALVAGVAAYSWRAHQRQAPLNLTTLSPRETYKVVVKGRGGQTLWPFTEPEDVRNRNVVADIVKQDVSVVKDSVIYSGDAYDSDFTSLYPTHKWLADNILYFGADISTDATGNGELLISNHSNQPVSYLYVKAGKSNIFLLLDLPTGASNVVPLHLRSWERVIGCSTHFSNGTIFPYKDVGFSADYKEASVSHFCLSITDSDVVINSTEFEGSTLDGKSVPKAACSH